MSTPTPDRITSLEALRRILPEPNPIGMAKVLDHLDEQGRAFLGAAPFLLLSTAACDGRIEVSPKGDEAGFVRIEDERTVLIPDRAGNNLAFGLMNIIENPRVGVIALRPGTGETLRFSGTAEILADPVLLESLASRGKPALLAIRVRIERAYFHCARSILRSGLWKPDSWPEPQKVSFGKILRKHLGADEAVVEAIDRNVEQAYTTGL
jgi:PPOX class probable FMN-dependent enzyme